MAIVAETDHVLYVVCIVYVCERGDWFDVMNVQCSSELGLRYLASLAHIAVELASEPLQRAPVCPVVIRVATSPTGIAHTTEALVRALWGTEAETPSWGKQTPSKNPLRSAYFALPCDWGFT